MTRPPRRPRPGFTLVELLVVITVIGILIALLVPVIAGAVRRAREAQVAAEINTLAQSLQSFKTKYGDFPPSRIILMENGHYDTTDTTLINDSSIPWYGKPVGTNPRPTYGDPTTGDITYGQLAQRSLRHLRKYFPRVNFSTSGPVAPGYDFNGDSTIQDGRPIYLEGHECLVFFLGGIPNSSGSAVTGYTFQGMGGFLNNPTNPFASENNAPNPRSRPLFEFRADRLVDEDGDGIPGYLDPLGTGTDGRPYAYFSAYAGSPYDPNDVNCADPTVRAAQMTTDQLSPDDAGSGQTFGSIPSFAPNPYTVGPSASGRPKYVNPESYQIISAGRDRNYGVGGQYDASGQGDRLPTDTTGRNPTVVVRERDNVTNFSNGTLE